jgi:agmatinase
MIDPAKRWQKFGYKPSYAGLGTFASVPYTEEASELLAGDVVIVGAPMDDLVTERPGTRYGPRAIRAADGSRAVRGGRGPHTWHVGADFDPLTQVRVIDFGDAPVVPGDPAQNHEAIERTVSEVVDAGAMPIILGGDHSIVMPDVAACAGRWGAVGMLHFDSHTDTGFEEYGVEICHGTGMYRLVEAGLIDPSRYVQFGLRGYWPAPAESEWQKSRGILSISMEQIYEQGIDGSLSTAIARIGSGPAFLSIDIDVLDPSHAPGTGTPDPGGMTAIDLMRATRTAARELDLVGAEVVEVLPTAIGRADITALIADRVVREIIAGVALRRRSAAADTSTIRGS